MRSRRTPLLALACAVLLLPVAAATARPAGPTLAPPPAGAISPNLEFLANVPEMASAISVNFIDETMFVSATTGVFAYSISDPAAPSLIGALPQFIWENEDVDVDVDRKLLFISRDPRGFTTPATPGAAFPYGMVQVIDVSLPHAMTQISQILVGAGHTTTCVNRCQWLWVGGPYANAVTQPGWTGRPIIGVDLRNPLNPVECPAPIDTGRNDGVTDYAHDVQVDAAGIAWVSGAGGVRGYWTSGRHLNPVTKKMQTADGCNPIPYAGGGTPDDATPSRFMHNAWRNLKLKIDAKDRGGNVLMATEENVTSTCESSGRFATFDLRSSYGGQGFRDIARTKYRLKTLDTWTPEDQAGSTGCASAHYFTDRGDGILAYAFYGQGTRILDVRNPRNIRQIGYFRPDDASTWAAYWHKGLIYVADNTRGIDVLRLKTPVGKKQTPTLVAPPRTVPVPIRFTPSPEWGWMCPVAPTAQA